jgi:two-component system chemotaxis response regulator CheY
MKKRVVFVDDDEELLHGLRRSLRALEGEWDTDYFPDPAAAVEALRRASSAVIVTDWAMPGMSGIELCRRVRELEKNGSLGFCYVVLLSGRGEVEKVVEALESGADDFVSKPFDTRELVARIRVGLRIVDLENELRRANAQLEAMAFTDPLTRLLNRRRGMEILETEFSKVVRQKQRLSVIMADIDHFKSINDGHGHKAGDIVLKEVAARLGQAARNYDSVIRWGGEEILVVCPHATADEGAEIAERFRVAIRSRKVEVEPRTALAVTASFGVAGVSPEAMVTLECLLERADQSLYRSKQDGRDRVTVFDEDG